MLYEIIHGNEPLNIEGGKLSRKEIPHELWESWKAGTFFDVKRKPGKISAFTKAMIAFRWKILWMRRKIRKKFRWHG